MLFVTAPVTCSDADNSTRPPTDDDSDTLVTHASAVTRASPDTDPPGPQRIVMVDEPADCAAFTPVSNENIRAS